MKKFSLIQLLARRFLTSKSSEGFVSFIAWVSIAGVSIGVLALVIVTSVINGFEGELSRVITGMNGDVILYSRGEPIENPEVIEQKIKQIAPEVKAVAPGFVFELMVSGPSATVGGVLEGFDREKITQVTALVDRVKKGRLPFEKGEVALGEALAERIGANIGSEIRIVLPFTAGSGQPNDQNADAEDYGPPKSLQVKVVGLVKMGMYEYDSKFLFATLPSVQEFLGHPGKVTAFKLKLKLFSKSREVSDRLMDHFGYPFRSKSWSQLNKNLLYAIELEKTVIAIILTVIILVAAFNVVSTLMMMIHDKSKEIAILKAMGFKPLQSFFLFISVGLGMGLVGTLSGVSLGLLGSYFLGRTQFIELPSDIYFIGFLPVSIRWLEVGYIAFAALFISFLATLYPAWKVSTRPALEGIRYE